MVSTRRSAGCPHESRALPHRRHVARRPRRRLVVEHRHGPDPLPVRVARERLHDGRRVDPGTPVALDGLDLEAEASRHFRPQPGEVPGLVDEHPVARRERVDERRLPRAGAGGGKEVHPARGPEHAAHPVEARAPELREPRSPVVDGRAGHGLQHPSRDVGGPRDLKEMASWTVAHVHSPIRRNPVRMIGRVPARRFTHAVNPRAACEFDPHDPRPRTARRGASASRRQSAWRRISRWVRPRYSVR